MTAQSTAPVADFGGELAPPPSIPFLSGEPVKVQASHLSEFLTVPGAMLQKVQQVDISMSPSKLRVPSHWQSMQEPMIPITAPPGMWFPPFASAALEPCFNLWPEVDPWIQQMMTDQAMTEQMIEPYFPWIEQVEPQEMYLGTPPFWNHGGPLAAPPPHLPATADLLLANAVDECTTAPGLGCTTAPVADQKEPGIAESSTESTGLSEAGETSTGEDEWSNLEPGSPINDSAQKDDNVPEDAAGSSLNGAEVGRMILSLLNSVASDAPDTNAGTVYDGSLDAPPGLPLPSGLPTPTGSYTSEANDTLAPPPGLMLLEAFNKPPASQTSGSDADVSDGEIECSASANLQQLDASDNNVPFLASSTAQQPAIHFSASSIAEQPAAAPCVAEGRAIPFTSDMKTVSPPAMQIMDPAPQNTTEAFEVVTRRKCNKPRQQRAKSAAVLSVAADEPLPAHHKKVSVAVPSPQQAVPASRKKGRVEPKQPRTTPPSSQGSRSARTSAAALLDEFEGLADTTTVEESNGFCSRWVRWLLPVLVLAATFFLLVDLRQDSIPVDPSLAYEISASAMAVPGASHAWVTAVPASASAHMWGQHIASLAKSMDIEFARASAVASSLMSKVAEVQWAVRASRQEKEQMRQFKEFQKFQQSQQQQGFCGAR